MKHRLVLLAPLVLLTACGGGEPPPPPEQTVFGEQVRQHREIPAAAEAAIQQHGDATRAAVEAAEAGEAPSR